MMLPMGCLLSTAWLWSASGCAMASAATDRSEMFLLARDRAEIGRKESEDMYAVLVTTPVVVFLRWLADLTFDKVFRNVFR